LCSSDLTMFPIPDDACVFICLLTATFFGRSKHSPVNNIALSWHTTFGQTLAEHSALVRWACPNLQLGPSAHLYFESKYHETRHLSSNEICKYYLHLKCNVIIDPCATFQLQSKHSSRLPWLSVKFYNECKGPVVTPTVAVLMAAVPLSVPSVKSAVLAEVRSKISAEVRVQTTTANQRTSVQPQTRLCPAQCPQSQHLHACRRRLRLNNWPTCHLHLLLRSLPPHQLHLPSQRRDINQRPYLALPRRLLPVALHHIYTNKLTFSHATNHC